jgi:hypothetical protein
MYWGIGTESTEMPSHQWPGYNHMGKVLMNLRDKIIYEQVENAHLGQRPHVQNGSTAVDHVPREMSESFYRSYN